jgi:hypothetical protein
MPVISGETQIDSSTWLSWPSGWVLTLMSVDPSPFGMTQMRFRPPGAGGSGTWLPVNLHALPFSRWHVLGQTASSRLDAKQGQSEK